MFSSEEPDRLRGPQHGAAWCDELCSWRNVRDTWDNLQFGLRLGKQPRQVITTTPKPIKLLKELVKRDGQDVIVTRGQTSDNAANLAPSFLSQIVARYEGTRLGRQELNAEILEDVQGALWTRDLLEQTRKNKGEIPPLKRIVIAIDPAVSVTESSDETGLLVCGLGVDGHGYVLEDASGKFSPVEWARRAVSLYRNYGADRIVAEKNQGGVMVESTIRAVDQNVSLKLVHASKGKITRAEPISALFEQRRAHLVGGFDLLEDQLATYQAGSAASPDRLDALVWGLTELMIEGGSSIGFLDYMEAQAKAVWGMPSSLDEPMIKLLAPIGMGSAQLWSGRTINIPTNRIVEMAASDAKPLIGAGWVKVESVVN